MQYRRFGKTGVKVSALGFGCMRFPTLGDDNSQIDETQATEMLRYAIESGVNYIDTAYVYHGGKCESFVGKALQGGYRERIYLATKMPVWLVENYGDFDRFFDEQLEKLGTDHIDFYLMHALNKERWGKIVDLDILKWIEIEKAKGRIRHIGFSFQDSYDAFVKIIDDYDRWEFCQVQYNYMNEEFQAGTKGLKYAFSKGLGVIVMEPILGGNLANPPEIIKGIWNEAIPKRTPADWALQWVWNKPEVSIILSGMSYMQQVIENVESADIARIDKFTQDELDIVASVRDKYREIQPIPCTDCRYCMPCPNGINIPHNFMIYNMGKMYNKIPRVKQWFASMKENGSSAASCIQCGECEEKCPENIKIMEWLSTITKELDK